MDNALEALQTIPANLPRDEWHEIGRAALAAGLTVDDLDTWSATAENYSGRRDVEAAFRTIQATGGTGAGTLFYHAKKYGFTRSKESRPALPINKPSPSPTKHVKQAHDTGTYGIRLWNEAARDDVTVGTHPYAVKKGIGWAAGAGRVTASGALIGRNADCLIVPIHANATGDIQGAQLINADGKKQTFGKVSGGCLVLGNTLDANIPWLVCEGWASAVSAIFHHHKGHAVAAVAFGKHNLEKTAAILASVFSPECITVLGECDD